MRIFAVASLSFCSGSGFALIVEAVQMQQPMHNVQLKLVCERISKLAGMSARGLGANKNFAVIKCDYISRTGFLKKLSM